eukprot:8843015-Alexandrium_andersonii.AAC.1
MCIRDRGPERVDALSLVNSPTGSECRQGPPLGRNSKGFQPVLWGPSACTLQLCHRGQSASAASRSGVRLRAFSPSSGP